MSDLPGKPRQWKIFGAICAEKGSAAYDDWKFQDSVEVIEYSAYEKAVEGWDYCRNGWKQINSEWQKEKTFAEHSAKVYEAERLKVAKLREALREAKDFAQDTLARANRAIGTDCDKCDYQCEGCIGAIDDCESVKKIIIKTLAETEDKT